MSRFDVLTNAGAGLGCLASVAALWMRGERPLVFVRFARLLLVIGVALVLRAIQLGAGNELAWHGCLVAAAVIPLLATLYIEALLRRQAHLVMKLVLLTGTAIFAATSLTPLIHDNGWWALSFAVYHVVTLGYVALLALLAAPRARRRVERSLFAAHALGGIACTALLVTDWLPTFQIDSPRLGAVGVFFLVYIVAAALSGGGAFRLRWLLLRVAIAGSVCASLAILVSAAAGVEVTWVAFLVLLFAYLVAEPLRLSLVELRSRPGELLVERLASLPARSLEAYLAALRQWPEIKVVDVIAPSFLHSQGFDRVHAWFAADPAPVTRDSAAAAARVAEADELVLAAEQVQTLLDAHGAQYAMALWVGGPILVVSFLHTVDATWVRPILANVGRTAGLLAEREGAR